MLGSAGSPQVVVLILTLFLKKGTTGDESTHSRERGRAGSTRLHSGSAVCSSALAAAGGLCRLPAQIPMPPKFAAWALTLSAIYPKICQLVCRNAE